MDTSAGSPDGLEALGDRISAKSAGYMELAGAVKDAECELVQVKGGVSSGLGCCNKFEPQDEEVKQFRCGTCEYLTTK